MCFLPWLRSGPLSPRRGPSGTSPPLFSSAPSPAPPCPHCPLEGNRNCIMYKVHDIHTYMFYNTSNKIWSCKEKYVTFKSAYRWHFLRFQMWFPPLESSAEQNKIVANISDEIKVVLNLFCAYFPLPPLSLDCFWTPPPPEERWSPRCSFSWTGGPHLKGECRYLINHKINRERLNSLSLAPCITCKLWNIRCSQSICVVTTSSEDLCDLRLEE